MKFDELDVKMRAFESAADYCVLPGMYMVARLDDRSFARQDRLPAFTGMHFRQVHRRGELQRPTGVARRD